jgi:hypothetical protein
MQSAYSVQPRNSTDYLANPEFDSRTTACMNLTASLVHRGSGSTALVNLVPRVNSGWVSTFQVLSSSFEKFSFKASDAFSVKSQCSMLNVFNTTVYVTLPSNLVPSTTTKNKLDFKGVSHCLEFIVCCWDPSFGDTPGRFPQLRGDFDSISLSVLGKWYHYDTISSHGRVNFTTSYIQTGVVIYRSSTKGRAKILFPSWAKIRFRQRWPLIAFTPFLRWNLFPGLSGCFQKAKKTSFSCWKDDHAGVDYKITAN